MRSPLVLNEVGPRYEMGIDKLKLNNGQNGIFVIH